MKGIVRRFGALLCAAALLCACSLALTGCNAGGGKTTLTIFNWEDYIDDTTLKQFEEETGIAVNEVRFTTNEDMFLKLKNNGAAYDVCFPSDYMIERMIKSDMIHPLDHAKIPNLKNVAEWIGTADYDAGMKYSAPYMWGTVGILYNTKVVKEPITSWNALWDPAYKDNILMINSIRDSMGIALKKLGYSLNTNNVAELEAARDELLAQADIRLGFGVDEIKDKLASNDVAIGVVWSGDAYNTIQLNPDLAYSVPDEGSNLWFDAMVIPKTAKNIDAAHQFINFMLRPDISAKNSEYIGYSTPIPDALPLLPAEMSSDPTFNPPQEVIDRCEVFHDLGDMLDTYNKLWTEITSGS